MNCADQPLFIYLNRHSYTKTGRNCNRFVKTNPTFETPLFINTHLQVGDQLTRAPINCLSSFSASIPLLRVFLGWILFFSLHHLAAFISYTLNLTVCCRNSFEKEHHWKRFFASSILNRRLLERCRPLDRFLQSNARSRRPRPH